MTTLVDVRTSIVNRLQDPNFTGISSANVDAAINTALTYYKRRRYWFNESLSVITLTIGNPIIPNIPSDFLEELNPGGLTIKYSNLNYQVFKRSSSIYDAENFAGVGLPYIYTYRNKGFELYFYPDQAYSLNLRYLKDYPVLVSNTDTNDFLNYADTMIYYNALSRIYGEYKQDPTMESYYTARAADEEDDLKRRSGSLIGTGTLTLHSQLLQ